MSKKNELRVFISSTFRDLAEEREHLIRKIFPEIRTLCRRRGITFTEVDLRWGLTEEEQVLGQIIRTCLEEIDRCRPWFIGITGDRYGYIPDILEIHKDPELLARYPWIEDAVMEEASIIDMEFRHAALNNPTHAGSPRFYFRRHRRELDEGRETGEEEKIGELKDRVRSAGFRTAEFRDTGTLGEMIWDDLMEIIETEFADVHPPTPLEVERSRHEAFAASRRRAYIPNMTYLKRLNEFADGSSGENALIVYAESGSGKSSLVAWWTEQYRRHHPEALLIEHYVGIGATSTDHYGVMRHIMEEIRVAFNRSEEIPSTPQEIEQEFANWLGFTAVGPDGGPERRVLIIIDGVNQLQGEGLNLQWLPSRIPPTIRLIATSTIEETLLQLRKRGWLQLGMQPLTEREREAIVVRFLSEYHKALSAEQIRRIASDQKSAHPLFLRTLLEELRLFGKHERLDDEIDRLLETTGTEDLFQQVLERIEEDFGPRMVREVMSLIRVSWGGLSEMELQELTDISRLRLSGLLNSLDYHLVRRDGLYTFFHDYLRRAVEKRYLATAEKRKGKHRELADYFQRLIEQTQHFRTH